MHVRSSFLGSLLMAGTLSLAAQGPALKAPIAAAPALVTAVGQSADIEMVKVLLTRGKIVFKADPQAKAGALAASGSKSLVLVIGGSSKGLGAAGISADSDIARAKGLAAEARKQGAKIIGLHVGGEGRRGQMSDTFITGAVPLCDYVIVVADGNKDGLFNQLCAKGRIPMDVAEKIAKAGEPLVKAFK